MFIGRLTTKDNEKGSTFVEDKLNTKSLLRDFVVKVETNGLFVLGESRKKD